MFGSDPFSERRETCQSLAVPSRSGPVLSLLRSTPVFNILCSLSYLASSFLALCSCLAQTHFCAILGCGIRHGRGVLTACFFIIISMRDTSEGRASRINCNKTITSARHAVVGCTKFHCESLILSDFVSRHQHDQTFSGDVAAKPLVGRFCR